MQRELKFRAWTEIEKYMAYQGHPDLETLYSFMFHYADFKDCILMQGIGILDKHGDEIFEGDYIKCTGGLWLDDYPKEGQIIFNKHSASFVMRGKNSCGVFMNMSLGFSDGTEIEVIGNIYENTELSQDVY